MLAVSNVAHLFGIGGSLASIGNLMFLGTALFTLVVCLLAWRRGSRAAGWFLIAWGLLEAATIATAGGFLVSGTDPWPLAWGLPASMVTAAVFVALGVADRLREQRLALSEAERRAQTDPLTGVLNRRSLLERLDAACLRAQARGLPISLLFIDLDHFKAINDTHGHAAGDQVLREFARRIGGSIRSVDLAVRLGGDEFAVLVEDIATPQSLQFVAEKLVAAMREPMVLGNLTLQASASIGVGMNAAGESDAEALVQLADGALYQAKAAGRNTWRLATAPAAPSTAAP